MTVVEPGVTRAPERRMRARPKQADPKRMPSKARPPDALVRNWLVACRAEQGSTTMISALNELYSWVQEPELEKLRRERMRSLVVTAAAICAGTPLPSGWVPPTPSVPLDELTVELVEACEHEQFKKAGLLVDKYFADRPGQLGPFSLLGTVFAELSGLAIRRAGHRRAPCLDGLMRREIGAATPRVPTAMPPWCFGG